jgi:hypothetical protein
MNLAPRVMSHAVAASLSALVTSGNFTQKGFKDNSVISNDIARYRIVSTYRLLEPLLYLSYVKIMSAGYSQTHTTCQHLLKNKSVYKILYKSAEFLFTVLLLPFQYKALA